jgi:hypothetical protein
MAKMSYDLRRPIGVLKLPKLVVVIFGNERYMLSSSATAINVAS